MASDDPARVERQWRVLVKNPKGRVTVTEATSHEHADEEAATWALLGYQTEVQVREMPPWRPVSDTSGRMKK